MVNSLIKIRMYRYGKYEYGRIRDQVLNNIPTESPSGKICIVLIYRIILQIFITIFIGSILLLVRTRFEIILTADWHCVFFNAIIVYYFCYTYSILGHKHAHWTRFIKERKKKKSFITNTIKKKKNQVQWFMSSLYFVIID